MQVDREVLHARGLEQRLGLIDVLMALRQRLVVVGVERRVQVVRHPAVARQHLASIAGRSTSSRMALRTLTLSNGGMSTAMQSGSQPPPGDSRILMLLWLLAVESCANGMSVIASIAPEKSALTCADGGGEVDHPDAVEVRLPAAPVVRVAVVLALATGGEARGEERAGADPLSLLVRE